MKKEDILKFCRLYKGQASIEDNPIKKSEDEFKWQMWCVEYVALHEALTACKNKDAVEEYIKDYIRNKIACAAFGGNSQSYYDKYFSY